MQDGLEDHFKSKAGKSFKTNYLELWDKVMRECQSADLLFDNYLLDKISYLVIALSWCGNDCLWHACQALFELYIGCVACCQCGHSVQLCK